MARIYAGILGPLAFLTSLAHGALHAWQAEAILRSAWMSLVIFSTVGCAAGWIAQRTIEEAVRARIAEQAGQDALENRTAG